MVIGIDAKCFYNNSNPSGREVVRNIINELLKLDDNNYYVIFLDKKFREQGFPYKSDRIRLEYIWAGVDAISSIFILPIVAWKYKLDALLIQYFTPFISNTKRVTYIHDCIFKSHPIYFSFIEKLYYLPIRHLSAFADIVVTISNSERLRLIKYRFAKHPSCIKVVHCGVNKRFEQKIVKTDPEIQEIKAKYNLPDRYLLYVGRLNERKNILNLLESINCLKDNNIKLVLVGQYNRKMFNLPAKLCELNLSHRVILLNYVDDLCLPIIYSLSTVFCYVSYQEGFGLPPLEAMASGVPVVVANSSSLPEICGEAGTYCNPSDPKDIAEKVDLLLSDDNVYQEKKELGVRIAAQFNWSNTAIKLVSIFNNLASAK